MARVSLREYTRTHTHAHRYAHTHKHTSTPVAVVNVEREVVVVVEVWMPSQVDEELALEIAVVNDHAAIKNT